MKVVILAGGFGTRLSEETDLRPKPMIEIGGRPMLWHIMKIYSQFGFNDFIICCGYKGYQIKDYFHHYYMRESNISIDLKTNEIEYHGSKSEPWRVALVDTGISTMTGGRIQRIRQFLDDSAFMLTYGDGVANIDIKKLEDFHNKSGRLATLTAVQPSGRFGALTFHGQYDNEIKSFKEKPQGDGTWVNGGFFVLEPRVFDYIREGDSTVWERAPLEELAHDGQLNAYKHAGFWKPMDSLRDKNELEALWIAGNAPWKNWND